MCIPSPLMPQGTSVGYAGTLRGGKRVSFSEYAEEFQFSPRGSDASSSVGSFTEEDILTAQGDAGPDKRYCCFCNCNFA